MAKQKKSFLKMAMDSKGNPAVFKKEVEENSAFTITNEQAADLFSQGFSEAFRGDRGLRGVLWKEQSRSLDGDASPEGNEHGPGRGEPIPIRRL